MGSGDYKILVVTDIHLKNRATFAGWLGVNQLLDLAGKVGFTDKSMKEVAYSDGTRARTDGTIVSGGVLDIRVCAPTKRGSGNVYNEIELIPGNTSLELFGVRRIRILPLE